MLLHRLASVPQTASMQQDLQGVLSFCEDINKEGLQALIERQEEVIAWQRQIAQRYQQQAFQVDAALAVRTPVLSQRLASAAAQAAELLLRMSPKGTPALAAYRTAFVQKYGAAEVSLLILLSAEHGLGAPTTYRQPPREYPLAEPAPTPYDAARSRLLCALLAQAMHAQSLEVQLTDAQCAALASWSPSSENPPPSEAIWKRPHSDHQAKQEHLHLEGETNRRHDKIPIDRSNGSERNTTCLYNREEECVRSGGS